MIDLWWMIIPMFIIWIQHRAIGKLKDKNDEILESSDELNDACEQLFEAYDAKKAELKNVGGELEALYRDIAESTKVSQPHIFLMSRIERRKQKKKENQ